VITRFRLEAEGNTKEEVQHELSKTALVFRLHDAATWTITDDVISKAANGKYKGRVVYKRNSKGEINAAQGRSS
jgi:hypothetical protein